DMASSRETFERIEWTFERLRDHEAERRLYRWQRRLREGFRGGLDESWGTPLHAAPSVRAAGRGHLPPGKSHRGGLQPSAQRGFDRPFLEFFEVVEDEGTACASALKHREAVEVPDVTTSPIFSDARVLEVLLDADVRAVRSAPLIGRGERVVGVLSVHYRSPL